MVLNSKTLVKASLQKHLKLTEDVKDKNQFESLIPLIVTPEFVGLFGDCEKPQAVKEIQDYVASLIPSHEVPIEESVIENGKIVKREVKDPKTGETKKVKRPYFKMTKGYEKVARQVEDSFDTTSVYWKARGFVDKNISTIDEKLFDRMNDYLWRHIMAVVFPDSIKKEFKHLCINIKRKLYYLGDRDEVHNQTLFGLYDFQGGGGKTTLLEAFAYAFSDDNPEIIFDIDSYFKFNAESAEKYGVAFFDEDSRNASVKNKLKQTVDSSKRKVEGKGKNAHNINNLLTMVVAANHKIGAYLFEDEARAQRRDATFEAIGNLTQYRTTDMKRWFRKMFAVCPIEDDSKTYQHHNPHSDELTDEEFTVLAKIRDLGNLDNSYKLGQLADALEITSKSPKWYALKSLFKIDKYFETRKDHDKSKFYKPKYDAICARVGSPTTEDVSWWSIAWRNTRPFIDVDAVIEQLVADDNYDCSRPIDYSEYSGKVNDKPVEVEAI